MVVILCNTACSITTTSEPQDVAQVSIPILAASMDRPASRCKIDDVVVLRVAADGFEYWILSQVRKGRHDAIILVTDVSFLDWRQMIME